MSRQLRADSPGRPRAFRVTDAEWAQWERAAAQSGHPTISAAVVKVMNAWARRVLQGSRVQTRRLPRSKGGKRR